MAATEAPTREEIDAAHAQLDGNGNGAVAPAPPDQLVLTGLVDFAELPDLGGKRPTQAVLTITGLSGIELQGGGFPKGTHLKLEAIVVVEEYGEKDHRDRKANITTACTLRHKAHAVDARVTLADAQTLED